MIDTSSVCSALALLDAGRRPLGEAVFASGRELDLAGRAAALAPLRGLTGVAIARGPGSFTGLRVGASFGLGLAMGLRVPLRGLGSLELQAARAPGPAIALVEAGRGRLYWRSPGSEAGHGEPRDLPGGLPAVGWLRPATAEAVRAAGVRLLDPEELGSFAGAAARLIEKAPELGYDTVTLEYMHSFVCSA